MSVGMVEGIVRFAHTAIGLVFFCFLGVIGEVEEAEVVEYGIAAQTKSFGAAIPPVAYYHDSLDGSVHGLSEYFMKPHEIGHLMQERVVGGLYYLVIAVPSVSRYLGLGSPYGYPEGWASRIGGVEDPPGYKFDDEMTESIETKTFWEIVWESVEKAREE